MKTKTGSNLVLETHMDELGLSWKREYKFHTSRRWRADYFVESGEVGTLVEIEGAVWVQGRHTRGSGYVKDLEKYRVASALGFKVFRFSTSEVLDGTAREFLKEWLCEGGAPPCGCDVEVNHLCDKHAMERARHMGLKTGLDDGVPLPREVVEARDVKFFRNKTMQKEKR